MADIVAQMRRAKAWVISNIAKYGGDPSRLTISGHSAGAQLATCLFSEGEVPSGIRAALLLGGLYDLKPLQDSFLKDEIALTDAEVTAFSPIIRHHDPATKVAILVGARETPPFHEQAADFARHLSAQGLSVSQTAIVARNHMDSVRSLGDPGSLVGRRLVDLIRSV